MANSRPRCPTCNRDVDRGHLKAGKLKDGSYRIMLACPNNTETPKVIGRAWWDIDQLVPGWPERWFIQTRKQYAENPQSYVRGKQRGHQTRIDAALDLARRVLPL